MYHFMWYGFLFDFSKYRRIRDVFRRRIDASYFMCFKCVLVLIVCLYRWYYFRTFLIEFSSSSVKASECIVWLCFNLILGCLHSLITVHSSNLNDWFWAEYYVVYVSRSLLDDWFMKCSRHDMPFCSCSLVLYAMFFLKSQAYSGSYVGYAWSTSYIYISCIGSLSSSSGRDRTGTVPYVTREGVRCTPLRYPRRGKGEKSMSCAWLCLLVKFNELFISNLISFS